MQDKQVSIHKAEQALSPRAQRLVELIESQWSESQMPSTENLGDIVSILPEPYKEMGLTAIAERFVNSMKLHLLNIVSKFYKDTESDEINIEEKLETLKDILADTHSMMALSKNLSVNDLDDLSKLSNITLGLHKLSKVNNAEDAQRWLYKLPALYQMKLQKEHLIKKEEQLTLKFSIFIQNAEKPYVVDALKTQVQEVESKSNDHWNKYLSSPTRSSSHVIDTFVETAYE